MNNQFELSREELEIFNTYLADFELPPSIPTEVAKNILNLYTIVNLQVYYSHIFNNTSVSWLALMQLKNLVAYYMLNLSNIQDLIYEAEKIILEP